MHVPSAAARHAWSATSSAPTVDVVLSSGFLAFAAHSGFLQAVADRGLAVRGCMGTSAGALTGALFAAGYAPSELASVLAERPPLSYLAFNGEALYAGLFRLDGAIARLRELLPPTFEELPMRFACGVIDAQGRHVTVSSGPLPEAVAASMAIPCLFAAVDIPGRLVGGPYADGGKVDRVGLRPWRQLLDGDAGGRRSREGPVPTICHVIERSSPFSGDDDVAAAVASVGTQPPVLVVHSPKSGQSLLGLREFEPQFQAARQRAATTLDAAREELIGDTVASAAM